MSALLTAQQAADDLALTYQRTLELARAGTLPSGRIGKYVRFDQVALERFKAAVTTGRLKVPAAPRTRPTPAPLAAASRRRRTSHTRRGK